MYDQILEYSLLLATVFFENSPFQHYLKDFLSLEDRIENVSRNNEIGFFYINSEISNSLAFLRPMAELLADDNINLVILILEKSTSDIAKSLSCLQGLRQLKEAYNKPIIAYSESQLLGANYIIACGADAIIISSLAKVGKIGCSSGDLYYPEKDKYDGIILNFIYSGKFKDSHRTHLQPRSENLSNEKILIEKYFNVISDAITCLRLKMSECKSDWCEGNTFTAEEALQLGLIDYIADRIGLIDYVLKFPQCENMNLKDINFNLKYLISDLSSAYKVNNGKSVIGILEIDELETTGWDYAQILFDFFRDKNIDKIILYIHSSGGFIPTSSGLYNDIKKLKKIYKKPVIAYIDEAQSSAYHVASATDYIIASLGALIGGIGVFIQRWDYTQKNEKAKLKYIAHTSGKFYQILNNNVSLDEDGKSMLQGLAKYDHSKFIEDVKESRSRLKDINEADWAEAQIFVAQDALELGLIDAIGSPLDAFNFGNETINNKLHEFNLIFKTRPKKIDKEKNKSID